jgi:glycosyltransferase involved in cell wall biosynthesis
VTIAKLPTDQRELSIILPVHNDAEYLAETVRSYASMLDRMGRTYELVLVSNGCTDCSVAVCDELSSGSPNIVHIDLKLGGWGRAVLVGIEHSRGAAICYTNVARTSAEVLGLLVAYNFAFPGVVVKASRKVRDNWWRRFGSLAYNLECRALFDLAVWDVNGTPKVFPRSFTRLLGLTRDDDLIDAEFVMRCRLEDYPIVDVPVLSTRRHGGKSTTGYRSAIRMYVGAIALRRRAMPGRRNGSGRL